MRSTLMALLALPLFALVACGGGVDDDVDQPEDTGTEPVEVEEPSEFDGDIDNDGVEDGIYDPIVNYGRTLYFHESIVGWSGRTCVYGYGFGGASDWETCFQVASEYTIPGSSGTFYGFTFDDLGGAYRVNCGREGADGSSDPTNWCVLDNEASGDAFFWQNPSYGNADPTSSLCFTVVGYDLVPHNGTTCNSTY